MGLSRPVLWLFLYSLSLNGSVAEICRGTHCLGSDTGDPRPCVGAHCPGGRSSRPPRQYNPTSQGRSGHVLPGQQHAHLSSQSRASSDSHAAAHPPQRARDSARTRAPEVLSPGCTGAGCVSPPRLQTVNDTRDCKGIECKLPLRIRPKPRPKSCVGEGCPASSEDATADVQPSSPVHMPDRAAQFLGEFPEFGYSSSELGGAPLGVQLTCDIKPGENEVPSEDALILHLQLAKGQEKLVEALRAQQTVIRELQQKLAEQQGALLAQQREILEQQRRMYEQMDVVKAQYGLLSDTVKQVSFQGLQGELQSYFESHLAGLQSQARSHLQKSYAVHKVDVDAKVMDVAGGAHFPQPLLSCAAPCGPEEYCGFQRDPPQCEKCTMCPPGFFLVSQCSSNADRICQDRDECLELPNICGERVKCLNTPGGFRCLGLSQREAASGICGRDYFYNQELEECQACSDCDGEPVTAPCAASTDAVCSPLSDGRLSRSWGAAVAVPPPSSASPSARGPGGQIFLGLQLNLRGKESGDLLSNQAGWLRFRQHGLVWLDHNIALRHGCRNFLQVGLRLNGSQEEEEEEEVVGGGRGRDLSGVRVEQPDGKRFQGVSVSAGAEVEPGHSLALFLKSPNEHCNQSRDVHAYELNGPSFSLLWLSHDTGAVAMTAQTSMSAHYQTAYRPAFRISSVSDPYMVGLTHDGRGVRFTESGVVKFVLQQALYAMGHACVREGFSLAAYVSRNGTAGQEATRAFKTGVNYRDTSVTLSGAAAVGGGDTLSFEVTSPPQCNIRYFGDSTGISMLSLVWIPSALSAALTATVSRTGLPSGAVRNKPLLFQQVGPDSERIRLVRSAEPHARRDFVFAEAGTANVALNLKLIHSCNVVKLTLHRRGAGGAGGQAGGPVAQQVSGHMPEGSEWGSVGLRASFDVRNGTAVYVTLDCVRGRVNQITHEGGTNISILWVAL